MGASYRWGNNRLRSCARLQNEACNMSAGSLPRRSVLGREPAHVAKIAHLRAGLQEHQNPLVDRVDHHNTLALGVLGEGLPDPSRHTLLFALVHDRTERRVDVAGGAPLSRQSIKISGLRVRAWVECELEFRV